MDRYVPVQVLGPHVRTFRPAMYRMNPGNTTSEHIRDRSSFQACETILHRNRRHSLELRVEYGLRHSGL
jgi:hypothetical protein